MPTPHIAAAKGEIAERILLPGDPLRAKYIAENFLEGAKEYTNIRNILGYTGTYKGHPISVQGTGMGMPSISIYVNELIREYGCKALIRIGSCGACHKDIHIRDVLIAQATTTDSSMPRNIFGASVNFAPVADFDLLRHAYQAAADKGISVRVGNVMSQDRFYDDEMDIQKLASYGVLGLEMEAAALYTLAAKYGRQALALFTVSDHLLTGEKCTAEERQTTFNDMIEIALATAVG